MRGRAWQPPLPLVSALVAAVVAVALASTLLATRPARAERAAVASEYAVYTFRAQAGGSVADEGAGGAALALQSACGVRWLGLSAASACAMQSTALATALATHASGAGGSGVALEAWLVLSAAQRAAATSFFTPDAPFARDAAFDALPALVGVGNLTLLALNGSALCVRVPREVDGAFAYAAHCFGRALRALAAPVPRSLHVAVNVNATHATLFLAGALYGVHAFDTPSGATLVRIAVEPSAVAVNASDTTTAVALVALYTGPLSAAEVAQNHAHGPVECRAPVCALFNASTVPSGAAQVAGNWSAPGSSQLVGNARRSGNCIRLGASLNASGAFDLRFNGSLLYGIDVHVEFSLNSRLTIPPFAFVLQRASAYNATVASNAATDGCSGLADAACVRVDWVSGSVQLLVDNAPVRTTSLSSSITSTPVTRMHLSATRQNVTLRIDSPTDTAFQTWGLELPSPTYDSVVVGVTLGPSATDTLDVCSLQAFNRVLLGLEDSVLQVHRFTEALPSRLLPASAVLQERPKAGDLSTDLAATVAAFDPLDDESTDAADLFAEHRSPAVRYTPSANVNSGAGLFSASTFTLADNATLTITLPGMVMTDVLVAVALEPVNDAPSFIMSNTTPAVLYNGSTTDHFVVGFVSNMSAGPTADEASQSLNFLVLLSDASFFAQTPTIDATTGTMKFRPSYRRTGTVTVNVILGDNGGTLNGGIATSPIISATLRVVKFFNVEPSFSATHNFSLIEGAAPVLSNNWAAAVDPGAPDETWQTLTFEVFSYQSLYFTGAPVVYPNGTVYFALAPFAAGVTLVFIRLVDNGGVERDGGNTSAAVAMRIAITDVNTPPAFDVAVPLAIVPYAGLFVTHCIDAALVNVTPGNAFEASQTITPTLTVVPQVPGATLFSVAPSIAFGSASGVNGEFRNGSICFRPALRTAANATLWIVLRDDGGTAVSGSNDTSVPRSVQLVMTKTFNNPPTMSLANATLVVYKNAGAVTVAELVYNVSVGALEADEQTATLRLAQRSGVAAATLFSVAPALAQNGTFTFATSLVATGVAIFDVWVEDNGGSGPDGGNRSATYTLNVTVLDIDLVPRVSNQSLSTLEDTALAFTLSFTSLHGHTAHVVVLRNFSLGTATIDALSGAVAYVPFANAWGTDTLLYEARGSVYSSAVANVTVVVVPVNDAPNVTLAVTATDFDEGTGAHNVSLGFSAHVGPGTTEDTQTLTLSWSFASGPEPADLFSSLAVDLPSGLLRVVLRSRRSGEAVIALRAADDGGTAFGGSDVTVVYLRVRVLAVVTSLITTVPTCPTCEVPVIGPSQGWVTLGVHLSHAPLENITLALNPCADDALRANVSQMTFSPSDFRDFQWINVSRSRAIALPAGELMWTCLRASESNNATDYRYQAFAFNLYALFMPDASANSWLFAASANFNTTEAIQYRQPLAVLVAANISTTATLHVSAVSHDLTEVNVINATRTVVVTPASVPGVLVAFPLSGVDDFVADLDQLVAVEISVYDVAAPSVVVKYNTTLFNEDNDVPGVVLTAPAYNVSELGTSVTANLTLASEPVASVTIDIGSSWLAEGVVAPSMVTLTPATWNSGAPVVVTGVRDYDDSDGDQVFNVTLRARTPDVFYDNLYQDVAFVNTNFLWPNITTVSPQLSSLVGGRNLTLVGAKFLPGARVAVANTTVAAANTTFVNVSSVAFLSPLLNASGYLPVTLSNVDGGVDTLVGVLYYTDNCPFENQFGRGLDCIDCPEGGICPGGYRIWPKPGYWNRGEDSGFVYPCVPPERCLGGRIPQCADGYTADFCATCAENYDRQGILCTPCPDTTTLALLIGLGIAFFSYFIVSLFVFGDEVLTHNVIFLIVLQIIRGTGQMASSRMPDFMLHFFGYLSLIALDFSFFRPNCSLLRVSTFYLNFIGTLMLLGMVLLAVIFGLKLCARMRYKRYYDVNFAVALQKQRWYQRRLPRAIIITLFFFHFNSANVALQAMACAPVGGDSSDYVLLVDESITCFTGGHIPVFIAGILIFVVYGLGFPIACVVIVARIRDRLKDTPVIARFGFIYESFDVDKFRHVGRYVNLAGLLLAIMLNLSYVALRRWPIAQFSCALTSVVTYLIVLLWTRPCVDRAEMCVMASVGVIAVFEALLNFFSAHEGDEVLLTEAVLVCSYLVVVNGFLTAASFLGMVGNLVRRRRAEKRERELHKAKKAAHEALALHDSEPKTSALLRRSAQAPPVGVAKSLAPLAPIPSGNGTSDDGSSSVSPQPQSSSGALLPPSPSPVMLAADDTSPGLGAQALHRAPPALPSAMAAAGSGAGAGAAGRRRQPARNFHAQVAFERDLLRSPNAKRVMSRRRLLDSSDVGSPQHQQQHQHSSALGVISDATSQVSDKSDTTVGNDSAAGESQATSPAQRAGMLRRSSSLTGGGSREKLSGSAASLIGALRRTASTDAKTAMERKRAAAMRAAQSAALDQMLANSVAFDSVFDDDIDDDDDDDDDDDADDDDAVLDVDDEGFGDADGLDARLRVAPTDGSSEGASALSGSESQQRLLPSGQQKSRRRAHSLSSTDGSPSGAQRYVVGSANARTADATAHAALFGIDASDEAADALMPMRARSLTADETTAPTDWPSTGSQTSTPQVAFYAAGASASPMQRAFPPAAASPSVLAQQLAVPSATSPSIALRSIGASPQMLAVHGLSSSPLLRGRGALAVSPSLAPASPGSTPLSATRRSPNQSPHTGRHSGQSTPGTAHTSPLQLTNANAQHFTMLDSLASPNMMAAAPASMSLLGSAGARVSPSPRAFMTSSLLLSVPGMRRSGLHDEPESDDDDAAIMASARQHRAEADAPAAAAAAASGVSSSAGSVPAVSSAALSPMAMTGTTATGSSSPSMLLTASPVTMASPGMRLHSSPVVTLAPSPIVTAESPQAAAGAPVPRVGDAFGATLLEEAPRTPVARAAAVSAAAVAPMSPVRSMRASHARVADVQPGFGSPMSPVRTMRASHARVADAQVAMAAHIARPPPNSLLIGDAAPAALPLAAAPPASLAVDASLVRQAPITPRPAGVTLRTAPLLADAGVASPQQAPDAALAELAPISRLARPASAAQPRALAMRLEAEQRHARAAAHQRREQQREAREQRLAGRAPAAAAATMSSQIAGSDAASPPVGVRRSSLELEPAATPVLGVSSRSTLDAGLPSTTASRASSLEPSRASLDAGLPPMGSATPSLRTGTVRMALASPQPAAPAGLPPPSPMPGQMRGLRVSYAPQTPGVAASSSALASPLPGSYSLAVSPVPGSGSGSLGAATPLIGDAFSLTGAARNATTPSINYSASMGQRRALPRSSSLKPGDEASAIARATAAAHRPTARPTSGRPARGAGDGSVFDDDDD